jgi:hypothetical protein
MNNNLKEKIYLKILKLIPLIFISFHLIFVMFKELINYHYIYIILFYVYFVVNIKKKKKKEILK